MTLNPDPLDSVLDTEPENVEATSGFEPLNRGFAALSTASETPQRQPRGTGESPREQATPDDILRPVLDTAKPRLLDLFCGAGGAAMGYYRAGFEVVGVDINPQPHYPFEFHQADAMTYPLDGFDVIHASPPCQAYSSMTKRWGRSGDHPDLVEPTRERLRRFGAPFVIENVVGAPLRDATMLCGSMFDLGSGEYRLRRHRLFEPHGFALWPPAPCAHTGRALPVYGHAGGRSKRDGLAFPGTDAWREGMGIDWMTGSELAESIPPAYTEWIGRQLIRALEVAA